jgi:hypothetical protein
MTDVGRRTWRELPRPMLGSTGKLHLSGSLGPRSVACRLLSLRLHFDQTPARRCRIFQTDRQLHSSLDARRHRYIIATMADDRKPSIEQISDDKIAPTILEAGNGAVDGHRKLVAPPLVAAMSAEERAQAEKKMRRKIDTRLLPMIILMYIMSMS